MGLGEWVTCLKICCECQIMYEREIYNLYVHLFLPKYLHRKREREKGREFLFP